MKKLYVLPFVLGFLCPCFTSGQICDAFNGKIRFEGKAPSPWAIDGSVIDWETLLGLGTGNPQQPYLPPAGSANNFSFDISPILEEFDHPPFVIAKREDLDQPPADGDIHFFATTEDDYNLYFYARRLQPSNARKSVYYFCDINHDYLMNTGEPVIKIEFGAGGAPRLSVCKYIPSSQGSGDDILGRASSLGHPCYTDGLTLPGTVEELFSSQNVPASVSLDPDELFAAATTEGGYGLEFALPWKFLRNWETNSNIFRPRFVFLYHVAYQNKPGHYNSAYVTDNAGSCFGSPAVSSNGDAQLTEAGVNRSGTSVLVDFKLTNHINRTENIGISNLIQFRNLDLRTGLTFDPSQINVAAYPDLNCNGIIDNNETARPYQFVSYDPVQSTVSFGADLLSSFPLIFKNPGESACFLLTITLPLNNSLRSFTIDIQPRVQILPFIYSCLPAGADGGKNINPVGIRVPDDEEPTVNRPTDTREKTGWKNPIEVFPNPSQGCFMIRLNDDWGPADLKVIDMSGRVVQQLTRIESRSFPVAINNPGIYLLQLLSKDGKRVAAKKIVIY